MHLVFELYIIIKSINLHCLLQFIEVLAHVCRGVCVWRGGGGGVLMKFVPGAIFRKGDKFSVTPI